MNSLPLNKFAPHIDLVFKPTPDYVLLEISDSYVIDRLTKDYLWVEDLANWIGFIQKDRTMKCPEIVRKAVSFSLGLNFTDDMQISNLNKLWLNKSESTDVLSFPVIDEMIVAPKDCSLELGDIVVSVQTAQRQAKQHNHLLITELKWLVTHGLLHLLGWDHSNPKQLQKMLNSQEHLMSINGNL